MRIQEFLNQPTPQEKLTTELANLEANLEYTQDYSNQTSQVARGDYDADLVGDSIDAHADLMRSTTRIKELQTQIANQALKVE